MYYIQKISNIKLEMMKNTIYIFALLVLGMLSFTSCNDEIQFPDPGFDLTSDKVVDIRRDTADYYHIDINMEAPNGVDYIEIINGYDQTVEEVLEDDHGKKNFTFSYDVDLRDIVVDSTLSIVINVVDLDKRSFNKGILINVKKFSFPEITLSGGEKVGLSAPSYYLKGLVTTGLNTIDSVQILLDGELIQTLVPDSLLSEWLIKENILVGALDEGVEYTLSIKIYDNIGQVGTKNIILVKQDLQKPYQID